jgi:hypothetical protein
VASGASALKRRRRSPWPRTPSSRRSPRIAETIGTGGGGMSGRSGGERFTGPGPTSRRGRALLPVRRTAQSRSATVCPRHRVRWRRSVPRV